MPIRNEAPHLERAVASILAQDYPLPFDVCLAVAPSEDDTERIAAEIARHRSRVTVVSNPAAVTPAALNVAIAATTGEVVVRVDGHAELSPGYIRRAVETMCRTGAVNVGGMQVPAPETPFEEAVAAATTSWLGTGGARFHVGGEEGPVDTVYLGVFDRAAGDAVGWFDETLLRNQDYELNIRLRDAGGSVWFDPDVWAGYRPRGSLRALAKQYYEYGCWKVEVLRIHPESIRLRQAAPALLLPLMVVAFTISRRSRSALLFPFGYLVAAVTAARHQTPAIAGKLLLVFPAVHFSWSAGFCTSLVRSRSKFVRGRSGRRSRHAAIRP